MDNTLTYCEDPYPHWALVHKNSGDRVRIAPERGGLITEWRCNGREILYFDVERYLKPRLSIRGGIPILFPICGNLPGNCLPLINGNFVLKQHGFARDSNWQIKFIDDQSKLLKFGPLKTRKISKICRIISGFG